MASTSGFAAAGSSGIEPKKWAKPLHIQRLERSLDPRPLLNYVEKLCAIDDKSDVDSSDTDTNTRVENLESRRLNGLASRNAKKADKGRLYNFTEVKKNRRWLQDLLLSDTDSSEGEDEIDTKEILALHQLEKKYRAAYYTKPENVQYLYYSAGLLSHVDKFPEHQKSITGMKKTDKKSQKKQKPAAREKSNTNGAVSRGTANWDSRHSAKDGSDDGGSVCDPPPIPTPAKRGRKKAQQSKTPEVLAMRRRKLWILMSKKEIGKVQRAKVTNHKEMLTTSKRMATACMRHLRQKAVQSQKIMKETVWRAKRLTREMQAYWKHYDRVERETRRRLEKEEEEQRKLDVELMEAKRQQRKLNFLITQTELYAHFMSKKMGHTDGDEKRILSQLEEERVGRLAIIDDYDSEVVKDKAKRNVQTAFQMQQAKTKQFDSEVVNHLSGDFKLTNPSIQADDERSQPQMFEGNLKYYQLKGMNWLANLYDQGINGILADEMGLGKTVQSIAFLAHVAESYNIWGPFLVIAPASTLHNWQQEVQRFVPDFKVIPYWGNPQDRRVLRQFWNQRNLHTKEASFHVVITSYNLVVTDFKYFTRIKWQYMILDEAQALKSTSSVRWKMLLTFSCHSRLLLSGTPIQNSMAELWALLHFIMPTLFDSHDEFNEWFSKDIESHAENKTSIDEKHLSRLHMILKPFMLRRIKKDVENELSDKIEVKVYCPLTTRQRLLYLGLKKKICIEDLLHSAVGGSGQQSQHVTSSLMNLVMQFRKVCNHPELFERREARSPFAMNIDPFQLPKFVFREGILHLALPSKQHLLCEKFFVFCPENIHRNLFGDRGSSTKDSCFSFIRFINLSAAELCDIVVSLLARWQHIVHTLQITHHLYHKLQWQDSSDSKQMLNLFSSFSMCSANISSSRILSDLVFTSRTKTSYAHLNYEIHSVPESMDHRLLRSRKAFSKVSAKAESLSDEESDQSPVKSTNKSKSQNNPVPDDIQLLPEFIHTPRTVQKFECELMDIPAFLYHTCPKVHARGRVLQCSDRSSAWWQLRHELCTTPEGLDCIWKGSPELASSSFEFSPAIYGGLSAARLCHGWSNIIIPDKQTLVTDAGKLFVLDGLLKRLKEGGHRVLIYSQMTRMIDLLEEYMWHRKHTYMRLDGSSKISDRRDMVADFQNRSDIFVFLLSTRAGGLGINLTAADTVIFYDSDWNPTVDQQAMDRAHRLGQTKQVTVYRLICKGTIEERILQRAQEKSEIQRMVISGGHLKPDALKPKEVVSLLLDDEEIEKKYRQRQEERKCQEEIRTDVYRERKRKHNNTIGPKGASAKRAKHDDSQPQTEDELVNVDSAPASPSQSDVSQNAVANAPDDASNDGSLIVDLDTTASGTATPRTPSPGLGDILTSRAKPNRGSGKRGRPRSSVKSMGGMGAGRGMSGAKFSPVISSPGGLEQGESTQQSPTIRRGPGRPRLKAPGPGHQGTRAPPRLMVPLGTAPLRHRAQAPGLLHQRYPVPSSSASTPRPARPFGFYTSTPQ